MIETTARICGARAWLSLLALAVACAPAPSSGTADAFGGCGPSPRPHALPPVDALVDSSRAARALAARPAGGPALFSLFVDAGDAARLYPIAASDAPTAADSLVALLDPLLRPQPTGRIAWAVRLAVTTGPDPKFAVSRSQLCSPVLVPNSGSGRIRSYRRDARTDPRADETVELQRVIGSDGIVATINRVGGNSPVGSELELVMRDMHRLYRFHPARLDGIPIDHADTVRARLPRLRR